MTLNDDQFNLFCEAQYEQYWPLLDIIAESYHRAHFKVDKTAQIEKEINEYKYLAFIDGSCVKDKSSPNCGKVGFGCYIYVNDGTKDNDAVKLNGQVTDEHYRNLENIGGELISALQAINFAISKEWPYITLCYDYMGIEMFANGKWSTKDPAVLDYVYNFGLYNKRININFVKVPAHTGIKGNEYADMLAKAAIGVNTDAKIDKVHKIPEKDKKFYKVFYKEIFKALIIAEMVALNPSTNDLSVSELFFNTRVKKYNLSEFLEKNFHIMETADADPLDIEYNDVMLE
jgi:ribonuclease HI